MKTEISEGRKRAHDNRARLTCRGCSTRLLEPSEHGYCRFCAIEIGLEPEEVGE